MSRNRFASRSIKFECASTEVLERFEDIARQFFAEILDVSYDDCLVTDESCLCHFITEETPSDYEDRFLASYGFELTNARHTRIADVAREIAASRRNDQVN